MNIINKQINENINKPSPEVLRLECYKQVEDYVISNKYDRKNEEVTDEEMDKIISKAEKLYQFISKVDSHKEETIKTSGIPSGVREAYLRWLDYKRVACRKPIEILKKILIVPSGFVFEIKDVSLENTTDKFLLSVKLIARCNDDEGEDVSKILAITKPFEELDLDFYDCTEDEPTNIIRHKEKSPIEYSDGRKCFIYTYEIQE